MKTKCIIILVFLIHIPINEAMSSLPINKNDIRFMILQQRHPGDPHINDQIKEYSIRTNTTIEQIYKIIMEFVELGWQINKDNKEMDEDRLVCKYAVDVLNAVGYKEALPLLIKTSETNDDNLRVRTMMAIGNLANAGELIAFANQIKDLVEIYSAHDMYYINYPMAVSVKTDESLRAGTKSAILSYYKEVIGSYNDFQNILLLDKILSDEDPEYRTSFEREKILEKIDYANLQQIMKDDIIGRLEKTRNMAQGERKEIGIEVMKARQYK